MEKDNLEELKKRLYKKGESFEERDKRTRIYGRREKKVSTYWQLPLKKKKTVFAPLKMIFIFATIFFLLSVGIFFYLWGRGGNIVSSRNIGMEIRGPVYIQSGDVTNINIFIENRNNSNLELADLVVDFSQGSFSPDGRKMSHERYSLGMIKSGESVKKPIRVVFLGDKDEEKTVKVSLEYRLAESNAIFAKNGEYTAKISRPPIGVSLSVPKEVNARQKFEIDVGVVSNSETIIKNLALKIEYPGGFKFDSAVPAVSNNDNIWLLGDFKPSEERKITIKGIIDGQDLEERAFRVQAGIIKENNEFVSYGASAETITLKKPFLDLSLFINGKNSSNDISFAGNSLRGELVWRNNLSVPVHNATLRVKIKGKALNEKSISISNGFYRTFDKSIIWNSSSLPQLDLIGPGETGRAQFSFSILDPLPVNGVNDKNFTIALSGNIDASAVSGTLGNRKIHSDVKKEIKIGSRLQLASMALHYSGVFQNGGPMPPKVGQETAYTIVWSLGNASNDSSNVSVRAALPSYVRWLGNILPKDANVRFDDTAGEVVWEVGDILAGTGIIRPAKEVSFQISIAPSVNQVGSSAVLIGETMLEGHDDFIDKIFQGKKRPLTTFLSGDSKFGKGEDRISGQ